MARKFPPECIHEEAIERDIVQNSPPVRPSRRSRRRLKEVIDAANERGHVVRIIGHPDVVTEQVADSDQIRDDLVVTDYKGTSSCSVGSTPKYTENWDHIFKKKKPNQG